MWLIYALGATFFISCSSLLEKKALSRIHALEFSATLAIVLGLVSLFFLPVVDFAAITPRVFGMLYLNAVLAGIAYILVMHALRHLDISLASPFLLLGSVVTTAFAYIFLGEQVTTLQGAGILLILLATFFLEYTTPNKRVSAKYLGLIVIAILLYGLTAVMDKALMTTFQVPTLTILIVAQIFLAVNMTIMVWIYRRGSLQSVANTMKDSGKYILVVALCTWMYRYLSFQAFALTSIGLVVAIKRSSNLVTTLLGGRFFHEHQLNKRILCCGIILIGVIMIAL